MLGYCKNSTQNAQKRHFPLRSRNNFWVTAPSRDSSPSVAGIPHPTSLGASIFYYLAPSALDSELFNGYERASEHGSLSVRPPLLKSVIIQGYRSNAMGSHYHSPTTLWSSILAVNTAYNRLNGVKRYVYGRTNFVIRCA